MDTAAAEGWAATDAATGEVITYLKGDEKPAKCVIKWANYRQTRAADMQKSLMDKVICLQRGPWPMNPDPIGCYLCDCRNSCDNFSMEDLSL